jgi:hypothetical protein
MGWPGPCIYTILCRIFRHFPAEIAVHTPYIYGVHMYTVMANSTCNEHVAQVPAEKGQQFLSSHDNSNTGRSAHGL